MSNEPYYPVEIQRNDQGTMRVQWADGHESHYAYTVLRDACPCATCREQRAMPQPRDPFQMVDDATATPEPTHLSTVGNYALNIEWRDGHRSGIYPWNMLRAMCPCPQCTASSA